MNEEIIRESLQLISLISNHIQPISNKEQYYVLATTEAACQRMRNNINYNCPLDWQDIGKIAEQILHEIQ